MTAEHVLLLMAAQLMALVSPGPAALRILRISLSGARLDALKFGAGLATAAACWAALAFAGLDVLFSALPWLFLALKLLGGLYLIYVAVQIWRGAATPVNAAARVRKGGAFVSGWLTNAANPKAAFFFSAVFLAILPKETAMADKISIVGLVLALEMCWYAGMVALFSHARSQNLYMRAKAAVDRCCSALLAALGVTLLTSQ
jgi:threonine/homoserine/homoserine lactone efflux protein